MEGNNPCPLSWAPLGSQICQDFRVLENDLDIQIARKYVFFSTIICILPNIYLEKAMATHSSTLAWKIPRTVEPDGLPSMGSQSRT